MKRVPVLLFMLSLAFSMVGCHNQQSARRDILALVEKNYETIVAACENKDVDTLYAIDGIDQVDIIDGYVLIFCEGYGIAPSSQYYGFYYSEENQPVAVFDGHILCDTTELIEEGKGYQYTDSGNNVFYTENMKGNLYFYSASF